MINILVGVNLTLTFLLIICSYFGIKYLLTKFTGIEYFFNSINQKIGELSNKLQENNVINLDIEIKKIQKRLENLTEQVSGLQFKKLR